MFDNGVDTKPGMEIIAGKNGARFTLHRHLSGGHYDYAIAEHCGMIKVVQSSNHRELFTFNQTQQANLMLNVEMVGGFVHQQQLRLLRQRPCNMQALFFSRKRYASSGAVIH